VKEGKCIMEEMRKDREDPLTQMELDYRKLLKDAAEASKKSDQLQNELDRVKKDNNDLFNRVADSLAINEDHQKLNGKLQARLTELEEENKKMHEHIKNQVEGARKAGM